MQVGQFESSDELLEHWLTHVWLEGGGGGNGGESYALAWYFASKHTVHDHFVKRLKKGVLFTIGDEPCLSSYSQNTLKKIMGDGEYQSHDQHSLLNLARGAYECFHIHIMETNQGSYRTTQNNWKENMGENLILAERKTDVADIIADNIIKVWNSQKNITVTVKKDKPVADEKVEIML